MYNSNCTVDDPGREEFLRGGWIVESRRDRYAEVFEVMAGQDIIF